jgi:hypothetical protein
LVYRVRGQLTDKIKTNWQSIVTRVPLDAFRSDRQTNQKKSQQKTKLAFFANATALVDHGVRTTSVRCEFDAFSTPTRYKIHDKVLFNI